MSPKENKAAVRRLIEEGVNGQNLSVFDELIDPSFVDHEAEGSEPGGPEGEKELLSSMRESFPDWRWEIEDMLAVEDKVVTRYVARGTHRGEFVGAPPTGREIEITGINIVRLEEGKIVESWDNSDQLKMLREIGVVAEAARF